jgi:hypothetical protein
LSEDLLTVDIFNFFRKKEDRCGGCREMTVPFTVTVLPPGQTYFSLSTGKMLSNISKREKTHSKGKKSGSAMKKISRFLNFCDMFDGHTCTYGLLVCKINSNK